VRRRRVKAKPATSTPHKIHRRSSDPNMRASSRIEQREYFDGPNNIVKETIEVVRAPRPPSPHASRSLTVVPVSDDPSAGRRHAPESDESDYFIQEGYIRGYRDDSRPRGRSRSSGIGPRRRRSRHSTIDSEGMS
jgi:hypothetical protein